MGKSEAADKLLKAADKLLKVADKVKKWPINRSFLKASIRVDPGHEDILRNVCNSKGLVEKILQIASYNMIGKLDSKELRKMKRLIRTNDTPEDPDLLEHYHLTKKDLITGVQCPKCLFLPMKYVYGTWVCSNCKCKSKTAHIQAINDYFLLIKPSITNSELRHFLHIDSPKSAHKILKSMNLYTTGTFKGRIYFSKKVVRSG